MQAYYVQSPVLFLLFNRSYLAQRIFEQIRALYPIRFHIAADGRWGEHAGWFPDREEEDIVPEDDCLLGSVFLLL